MLDARVYQSPQQRSLSVQDRSRGASLDGPAPRIGHIERGSDLRRAALRHHEEAPPVLPSPPIPFAEVQDQARASPLDLIGDVSTVLAELASRPSASRQSASLAIESVGMWPPALEDRSMSPMRRV